MILVGITGEIASGKTFALNYFKSKKIKVFSADEEVKKVLNNERIKKKIYRLFPNSFKKNKLFKKKLAEIVFNNKKKLKDLENIVHPKVGENKKLFLKKNKKKKILIMEIPIIFEKRSNKNYDYIVLMNVNKKVQFKRVMKRKGMTPKLLNNILSNQISKKKKKIADFVVNNNGKKVETRKSLDNILKKILSTAL